ncbi:hypothetical protein ES703_105204 [subsurface metagenome]
MIGKLIGIIPKNSLEEVRVAIEEYKGYQLLDIRVYFHADDGEPRPTKKGISINLELFDEFYDLVRKAAREVAKAKVAGAKAAP